MLPMVPAVIFFLRQRRQSPVKATRGLIFGLTGFNVVVGMMAVGIGLVWLASPTVLMAATANAQSGGDPYASLAAALATGLAVVGAGVAVGGTGGAAIGAIAEKPETLGRSLIFVGLAEGLAIYGLIISFMVLNR
ncbi:MAG: ATPase [Anaerolineae bacterium]|nr:ATPase [Anaerolineae bacterium]